MVLGRLRILKNSGNFLINNQSHIFYLIMKLKIQYSGQINFFHNVDERQFKIILMWYPRLCVCPYYDLLSYALCSASIHPPSTG